MFIVISALAGHTMASQGSGFMVTPAGGAYRVVNVDSNRSAAAYDIKPVETGDPFPAIHVDVDIAKPISLTEAVNAVLKDTDLSASFVGVGSVASHTMDGIRVSGDLKAVLETIAQSAGLQILYRDSVARFTTSRSYVLAFAEASDLTYVTGLIRKNGGVVATAPKGRNEVIFSSGYANMRRLRSDLDGFYALKRDPTQKLSARSILVPERVIAASSAMQPMVRVSGGMATARWRGEVTELLRQLAAASNSVYAGTEGRPRAIRVEIDIAGKTVIQTLEIIGNALGDQADLIVKGNKFSIVYR